MIAFFNANPNTLTAGQSSTLSWGLVSNADNAVIDQGIGGVATPGSTTVKPGGTTTYTLTANGCGGTATRQVTVKVNSSGGPGTGQKDLGVNEIYAASSGKIIVRLRNAGTDTLTNVNIKLTCTALLLYPPPPQGLGPLGKTGFNGSLSLSLNPGATSDYETGISRDSSAMQVVVTCLFTPSFNDTNSGNNKLTRDVK